MGWIIEWRNGAMKRRNFASGLIEYFIRKKRETKILLHTGKVMNMEQLDWSGLEKYLKGSKKYKVLIPRGFDLL